MNKMSSLCIKPIYKKNNDINFQQNNLLFYQTRLCRYIPSISIYCNINIEQLIDFIQFTFFKEYKLSVFGYNNRENKFWAKKIINNNCILYFTLNILYCNNNRSKVTISPIIGNDIEIQMLINTFTNLCKIKYVTI